MVDIGRLLVGVRRVPLWRSGAAESPARKAVSALALPAQAGVSCGLKAYACRGNRRVTLQADASRG